MNKAAVWNSAMLVAVQMSLLGAGCVPAPDGTAEPRDGAAAGSGGTIGTGGAGTGGAQGTGGTGSGGVAATGGAPGTGGVVGSGGSGSGGSGSGGRSGGTGGAGSGGSGTGGATGSGGAGTTVPGTGGVTVPANCNLSNPVSFKKDVEPFLTNSCGKAVGGGCHVTDAMSTMGSGGWDHAYDWITAGSHDSSCPETPTPTRFAIVLDVIARANPTTCSRSRKMPPPGMGTPPTDCQLAALRAWLALPKVLQMHRADDSSPTTPYLMPPYN